MAETRNAAVPRGDPVITHHAAEVAAGVKKAVVA